MRQLFPVIALILLLSACSTPPKQVESRFTGEADGLVRQGKKMALQGKTNEALVSYELAYNYYSAIDDLEGMITVELKIIGELAVQNRRNEYEKRMIAVRVLIETFLPDYKEQLQLLEVEIAFARGNRERVITLTDRVVQTPELNAQMIAYRILAILEEGQDPEDEAKQLTRHEKNFRKKTNRQWNSNLIELHGFISFVLGRYYFINADYDAASNYFERALVSDRAIDNISGIAKTLYLLGLLNSELGEQEKAKVYLIRSRSSFDFLNDQSQVKLIDQKLRQIEER